MASFSAQVDKWARKSEKRLLAIFRLSAQDVAMEVRKTRSAGGHMRVDTGFLRASLLASKTKMPTIDNNARPIEGVDYHKGETYPKGENETFLVIATTRLGQTIYLGFTANYAAHREYGVRGQTGDGFVRLTAQKWPKIVRDNVKLAKLRVR